MAKYVITYNPYQNKTTILKNGIELKKNDALCKIVSGVRLQSWFEKDKRLGEKIDEDNNEKECHILFRGREIDFVDLKDYFEKVYVSERKTEFVLESEILSNDDDIVAKLFDFVETMEQEGEIDEDRIEGMKKQISKIKTDPFAISVLATMSSGKSTLLNALMHEELLPTGNDATTANIVEIYDNDQDIKEYIAYDKDEQIVARGRDVNLQRLEEINRDKKIRTVKIYGDIPSANIDKMQLMLRDTPGPNNSENLEHKAVTDSVITNRKGMSAVLYVMNGTDRTDLSAKELLTQISKEMESSGKQANDRFLFVINKVDERLIKSEPIEQLIIDTKKYLEEFNIDNPRLFPVAAQMACYVWKKRGGYKFTPVESINADARMKIFNMDDPGVKLDEYASISQCVRRQLDNDLKKALEGADEDEIALIHSGIKGLEYSIKEYMDKYAYPQKIEDAVMEIKDTLTEKEMYTELEKRIFEDKEELENLKKRLRDSEKEQKKRETKKKEFEHNISTYVLDDEVKRAMCGEVDNVFADLVDETLSKIPSDKLKRNRAIAIVESFAAEVAIKEKQIDRSIKEKIDEEVIEQGKRILSDYREYIKSVKEEYSFANFDFGSVKGFRNIDISDLNDVARKVTSTEDITVTKTKIVVNPKRHWYTPWRPKTINKSYKEKVGEIEYVSKNAVYNDIVEVRTNARKNVDEVIDEAESLISAFKDYFEKRMKELDEMIQKVESELKRIEENQESVEGRKDENEKKLKTLQGYKEKIDQITEVE